MASIKYETRTPHEAVQLLRRPAGLFLPTRLSLGLGEPLTLDVHACGEVVQVPVIVVGRRLPQGARGALSTGLMVRAMRDASTALNRLDALGTARLVPLAEAKRQRFPAEVSVPFAGRDSLAHAMRVMGEGQVTWVPVAATDAALPGRGDRVQLVVSLSGVPQLELGGFVRGHSHRDGERALLVGPLTAADRARAASFRPVLSSGHTRIERKLGSDG